jgi:hypothetical protein
MSGCVPSVSNGGLTIRSRAGFFGGHPALFVVGVPEGIIVEPVPVASGERGNHAAYRCQPGGEWLQGRVNVGPPGLWARGLTG